MTAVRKSYLGDTAKLVVTRIAISRPHRAPARREIGSANLLHARLIVIDSRNTDIAAVKALGIIGDATRQHVEISITNGPDLGGTAGPICLAASIELAVRRTAAATIGVRHVG